MLFSFLVRPLFASLTALWLLVGSARPARALTRHVTVVEDIVLFRVDAGDEGRVVGPRDRGIRDRHRIGDDAGGGEAAEIGQRDRLVAPKVGGKPVDREENDVAVSVRCEDGNRRQQGEDRRSEMRAKAAEEEFHGKFG